MNSESNSTKSIDAYFDSLSYTGLQPPPQLFGDFNNDNKVDAGDYVIWRKNEAANASLPNDNGLTTQAERYALWRANFGSSGNASAAGSADGNAGLDREGLADWQARSPASPPATAAPPMMAQSFPDKSDEPAPPDDGPTTSARSLPTSAGEVAQLRRKTGSAGVGAFGNFASQLRQERIAESLMLHTLSAIDGAFQHEGQDVIDVRLAENDEAVQCFVFEALNPAFVDGVDVGPQLLRRHLWFVEV
jgi:hypothetical protein